LLLFWIALVRVGRVDCGRGGARDGCDVNLGGVGCLHWRDKVMAVAALMIQAHAVRDFDLLTGVAENARGRCAEIGLWELDLVEMIESSELNLKFEFDVYL
jgi:hypothetical protein